MSRESGGRSNAINRNTNGSTDYGCLQLNTVHLGTRGWAKPEQAYDPAFNINYALLIYKERGWRAWYGARGIYW